MEHRPRTDSAVKRRAAAMEHGTRATAAKGMSSSAVEGRTAAASEHCATAMERRATAATAVKGRAAMEAAASAAVETTAAAMSSAAMSTASAATMTAGATNLNGQSGGRRLCGGPGTRTHRRHRKRRPTGRAR
ncbi:hypothetical protein S58_03780 [Bradyrhizobium oligotrophicum S58]|uniref:Uncharacterized protein n=1 Tax=Bradyrhizobium oligotrophicum S58 TaxID=1245469 RepID=M4Z0H0_9BRAD|nr:hypothetical protein S58_03780 [Bradyrhizobium oligotrophicum S58]